MQPLKQPRKLFALEWSQVPQDTFGLLSARIFSQHQRSYSCWSSLINKSEEMVMCEQSNLAIKHLSPGHQPARGPASIRVRTQVNLVSMTLNTLKKLEWTSSSLYPGAGCNLNYFQLIISRYLKLISLSSPNFQSIINFFSAVSVLSTYWAYCLYIWDFTTK